MNKAFFEERNMTYNLYAYILSFLIISDAISPIK